MSSPSESKTAVSKRPRGGDEAQPKHCVTKRPRTSGPGHTVPKATVEAKVEEQAPATAVCWDEIADTFVRDGVAIFPVYKKHYVQSLAELLAHEITHAPEWLPGAKPVVMRNQRIKPAERHALGGFGGVRANSVNHGVTAIAVRNDYDDITRKHLLPRVAQRLARGAKRAHWGTREVRGYQVLDRALLRDVFSNVTEESKHRDLGTVDDPATVMCGGWVCLGTANGGPQRFRCAPGTSLWCRAKGGFNKAAAKTIPEDAPMVTYEIPIGCAIIFDETIVHCVERAPKRRGVMGLIAPMTRVFTACCMTIQCLSEEAQARIARILRDGADFRLKSGQRLPGYPAMYWGLQFKTLKPQRVA